MVVFGFESEGFSFDGAEYYCYPRDEKGRAEDNQDEMETLFERFYRLFCQLQLLSCCELELHKTTSDEQQNTSYNKEGNACRNKTHLNRSSIDPPKIPTMTRTAPIEENMAAIASPALF